MVLAAKGDLEAAVTMAPRAMAEHDRRPMPFERARTQLLLGQLQRRQRQKRSAAASLGEALSAFETMDTAVGGACPRGVGKDERQPRPRR